MPRITNSFDPTAYDKGFGVGRKRRLDQQAEINNAGLGRHLASGQFDKAQKFAFDNGMVEQGLGLRRMQRNEQNDIYNRGRQEKADGRSDQLHNLRLGEHAYKKQQREAGADQQAKLAQADKVAAIVYTSKTPELWAQNINRLRQSGVDIGPEYDDFGQRESVLAEYAGLDHVMAFNKTQQGGGLDDQLKKLKIIKMQREARGVTGKSLAEDQSRASKTRNIHQGIENLAGLPGWAKKNKMDFDGSIGPLDNSIAGRASSVFFDPGEGEVRRRISGDVEALAAAIKPLIRKPGEGAWTDKDQERLVSVVGDLTLSRNTAEYQRALSGVRKRINTNFGLNIPVLSFVASPFPKEARAAAERAIAQGKDRALVMKKLREKFGNGAQ